MFLTLGKMRESGIRTIDRLCSRCGSHGIVHVDGLPGDIAVMELGKSMHCTICGAPETETQPNWHESHDRRGKHVQPTM